LAFASVRRSVPLLAKPNRDSADTVLPRRSFSFQLLLDTSVASLWFEVTEKMDQIPSISSPRDHGQFLIALVLSLLSLSFLFLQSHSGESGED
jgi:hypothetical protein